MNFLKDKTQKKQFIMTYAVFIANGMLALSLGSLLPFIRDHRGLDYAFCGLIVSLHSVGNLISGFVAGALPMLIGKKKSIMLFELFFPISFLIILFGKSNFLLAFAFFATGLARGAASNYCNTKINYIATGVAWVLNGLHAMFAIGAFVFPLLLMFITKDSGEMWVYACGFMIVLGIITCTLYLMIPEEEAVHSDRGRESESDKSSKPSNRDLFGFFKEPLFYICTGTLFFYLCAEQGVIGWMITYFKDTGLLPPNLAQSTASILWVMILLGRLSTAYASTKVKKENLLPAMGFGIVIFFIVLIISKSTVPIIIGIMGFGFSMAGIYATTVSFAGKLIRKYSLAWSFILTTASLGSILMPSIIGLIADTFGIATGMGTVAVALVIDMVLIFVLVRYIKKTTANSAGKIS
ncbi:MAG: MFS transporter [Lachnospiraceae bacterium]|nr:MFS transporter [Lachnospiraceae bacterium]